MAKRSREDFEPPDLPGPAGASVSSAQAVTHPTNLTGSSSIKSKITHLNIEGGEVPPLPDIMRCSLPPHRQTLSFTSYEDYEAHYNKSHVNRCLECRKNFPTERFLNLHIEENHDAIVSVRRDRGEKTYACFVDGCSRFCSTPQKRRLHLIDKHMFPKDYDFFVVDDGIDHRSSMLRSGRHRRQSSAAQHLTDIGERAKRRNSTEKSLYNAYSKEDAVEGGGENLERGSPTIPPCSQQDIDMDGLASAMSALKFVPPSVRFGRGRGNGRVGFSRT